MGRRIVRGERRIPNIAVAEVTKGRHGGRTLSRQRPLRVGALLGPYSSYSDALFKALSEECNAEIRIVYRSASPSAPFDDSSFSSLVGAKPWQEKIPEREVAAMLEDFEPDALVVTSWNYGAYVRIARRWRNRAVRIMMMDNQWLATLKQRAGTVISPFYVRPSFDIAFLPNDRQRTFARRLGFKDEQIWNDLLCGDQPTFEAAAQGRRSTNQKSFLYVGRLVPVKGVDVLVAAYKAYRRQVEDPWPLRTAGTGPLETMLADVEGVEPLGFQQPSCMPQVFAEAGCFVLPSTFEPWGVVVHEAAASALPIICTVACGASLDLVRHGYNGLLIPAGNTRALTDALVTMTMMGDDRRTGMSCASASLSRQLTPARWAQQFDERVRAWFELHGGG